MIFHKGRLKKQPRFLYGKETIAIVNEFNYLGIIFTSSGIFNKNLYCKINSSRAAIKSVNNIIYSCKSSSWQSNNALFRSLSSSILFYSIENWGLRYIKEIDKFQISFYKQLLNLPKYCPNYAVRIETNCLPLSWYLLNNVLNWIKKNLKMEHDRLPQDCLYKLVKEATKNKNASNPKYNWIQQLNAILQVHNLFEKITTLNINKLVEKKETILEKYRVFMTP